MNASGKGKFIFRERKQKQMIPSRVARRVAGVQYLRLKYLQNMCNDDHRWLSKRSLGGPTFKNIFFLFYVHASVPVHNVYIFSAYKIYKNLRSTNVFWVNG